MIKNYLQFGRIGRTLTPTSAANNQRNSWRPLETIEQQAYRHFRNGIRRGDDAPIFSIPEQKSLSNASTPLKISANDAPTIAGEGGRRKKQPIFAYVQNLEYRK